MFSKIQLYIIGGLGIALVLASTSAYVAYGWYVDTKEELERVEIVLEKTKSNLELVSSNLEKEQTVRKNTSQSLMDLKGTKHEVREAPLPPELSDTIIKFRERMQPKDSKSSGK